MKAKLDFKNPFITGQPAVGSDFFGHTDILPFVKSFLQKDNYSHFFIFGKRRSGKTTLLKYIATNIQPLNASPIYINLQDKAEFSANKLAYLFAEKVASKLGMVIHLSEKYSCIQFIEQLMPSIKAQNTKITLLLDEFDVFCEAKTKETSIDFINFLTEITRKIIAEKIPLKIIAAAGQNYNLPVQKACADFSAPAQKYFITDFDQQTTKKLLQLAEPEIPFTAKAINKVYKFTNGNPYFTQCLAYKVYDVAEKLKAKKISEKMINWQFTPAIKAYGNSIEVIWNRLEDFHKIILYFVATKKQQVSSRVIQKLILNFGYKVNVSIIIKGLKILKKERFLTETNSNKYIFSIPFFKKWIQIDISEKEIREYFSNLEILKIVQ